MAEEEKPAVAVDATKAAPSTAEADLTKYKVRRQCHS